LLSKFQLEICGVEAAEGKPQRKIGEGGGGAMIQS